MNIVEEIRKAEKLRGMLPRKILVVKPGRSKVVRFAQDFDEAVGVYGHDYYSRDFMFPCFWYYGKDCTRHYDDGMRTHQWWAWTVCDLEDENKRRVAVFPYTPFSPIDDLGNIACGSDSQPPRNLRDVLIRLSRSKADASKRTRWSATVESGDPGTMPLVEPFTVSDLMTALGSQALVKAGITEAPTVSKEMLDKVEVKIRGCLEGTQMRRKR